MYDGTAVLAGPKLLIQFSWMESPSTMNIHIGVAGRQQCFSATLVLFGAREAGCFRGRGCLIQGPCR